MTYPFSNETLRKHLNHRAEEYAEIRNKALEEAAKLCDWMPDGSGHFGNCAAAIRALKAKP